MFELPEVGFLGFRAFGQPYGVPRLRGARSREEEGDGTDSVRLRRILSAVWR